jgi:hypothetical protein
VNDERTEYAFGGAARTAEVAAGLVHLSCYFEVTPIHDGQWKIAVHPRDEPLMARAIRGVALQEED